MINDNPLVEEILKDADAKAKEILSRAEKQRDEILDEARDKVKYAIAAENRSFDTRLGVLKAREESAKRNIDRLRELRKMDYFNKRVMDGVDEYFREAGKSGSLSSVLVSWLVEAAVGLGRKEGVVSYSPLSPLSEDDLREAEGRAERDYGLSVALRLGQPSLTSLGVAVSSIDGSVSYTNTLSVRKRRFLKEIRKIIQEENEKNNR